MKAILNTGRTVWQGEAIESGKDLQMYVDYAAKCDMSANQFEELGIKEGDNVEIVADHGSVVLRAVKAKEALPEGMIYVPMGPWANRIVDPNLESTAMPSFKGVPVEVFATDKPVLDMPTLMKVYNKASFY